MRRVQVPEETDTLGSPERQLRKALNNHNTNVPFVRGVKKNIYIRVI